MKESLLVRYFSNETSTVATQTWTYNEAFVHAAEHMMNEHLDRTGYLFLDTVYTWFGFEVTSFIDCKLYGWLKEDGKKVSFNIVRNRTGEGFPYFWISFENCHEIYSILKERGLK